MRWSDNQLTEGKVQGLGGEVTDDVGGVTTQERYQALVAVRAGEAVDDALVGRRETALLDLEQRTTCQTTRKHGRG